MVLILTINKKPNYGSHLASLNFNFVLPCIIVYFQPVVFVYFQVYHVVGKCCRIFNVVLVL